MTEQESRTVVIIGAGPSGAVASALLQRKGHQVLVLERAHFPRFSIGESLLPQCMEYLQQAGLAEAVEQAGFQFKNGAAFCRGQRYAEFDFTDKFSPGPGTTYQVQRGRFDQLLADGAAAQGVEIRYGHSLTSVQMQEHGAVLEVETDDGGHYRIDCQFVLDASGFARVLPRLLSLESPSDFPNRKALFTHIEDRAQGGFDRNKILITVHPDYEDVWFWLIPFSDGRASLGVVASAEYFDGQEDQDCAETLKRWVADTPSLAAVLADARFDQPVNQLQGYSANVSRLAGPRFALLGNAGEFLDPVFSSGVTIAMKSAVLAADVLHRQLQGQAVDWQQEYSRPLQEGVDTFKTYVKAWYDGRFQSVVFHENANPKIRQMVCSILAGYAWDRDNPFVKDSARRLAALVEVCQ
ncbi:NAD(P)/FAD-dependent oxidoreductase [Ferrimonas kyonanensis]|uniref:NAD(P)/FAD-dependent oxidoreductase n=1 Tax=Ferrimonas kyonanensis TaxID=364763 RepID=UPI000423F6A0|nr:NAD(P)/FAD-dependent oxidoreductase [Ferrimonas kyonanensis]